MIEPQHVLVEERGLERQIKRLKEILRALDINAKVDWLTVDPNKEFKDLKKFVRQLFKDYREGND